MKLSKSQLEVLANKIADEINKPIRDNINKIRASDKYINFTKVNADCKRIRQIYEKNNIEESKILQALRDIKCANFEIDRKVTTIRVSDIMNDLVLATIESSKLDEIIEKIKSKYAAK